VLEQVVVALCEIPPRWLSASVAAIAARLASSRLSRRTSAQCQARFKSAASDPVSPLDHAGAANVNASDSRKVYAKTNSR
jgi:hypothetical protein